MTKVLFSLFCCFLFLTSCEDDVNVYGEWQENMVVYGLLNQNESNQFIKINKCFIGNGDAREMAKVSDSLNYNPATLEVSIQRVVDGIEKGNRIYLHDTILPNAASGAFSKDENIIYTTFEKLYDKSEYHLLVKNKSTNKTCRSSVKMIDRMTLSGAPTVTFMGGADYFNYNLYTTKTANAKITQLIVYFEVKEVNAPGDTLFKSIEWKFPEEEWEDVVGSQPVNYVIDGEKFYTFLASRKELYFPENGSVRYAGRVSFLLKAGGDELNRYIEFYSPQRNSNIASFNNQAKEYTNVEGGFGIFSCRYTSALWSKPLSEESIEELVNGKYTSGLGFAKCNFCSK